MTNVRLSVGVAVLALNTAYLTAFNSPSLFYFANVVLHFVLGLLLAVAFGVRLARARGRPALVLAASALLAAGTVAGMAIVFLGVAAPYRWLLPVHIALSLAGAIPLLIFAAIRAFAWTAGRERTVLSATAAIVCVATISSIAGLARNGSGARDNRIV